MDNTSTSSDSEIESNFRISTKSSNKCLICEKPGSLIHSTDKSLKTFMLCLNLREKFSGKDYSRFHTVVKSIKSAVWHKNCYSSFTSKKNIDHLCKKSDDKQDEDGYPSARFDKSLRKEPFDVKKCLFCQKKSTSKKLCQVLTTNAEEKMKKLATMNSILFQRIGSYDLIAAEIKYHNSCFSSEWQKCKRSATNKEEEYTFGDKAFSKLCEILEKGFLKRKGYGLTSIYQKYLDLGGTKSKRQLIRMIQSEFCDKIEIIKSLEKNKSDILMPTTTKSEVFHSVSETLSSSSYTPVFTGVSEYSTIHKICSEIKLAIENLPDYKQYKNLNIKDFKTYIPENLLLIISCIINNDSDEKESEILSICQDIIYSCSKHKQLTPKHIGLGMMIHQENRSKKIINTLHECGHSISYKEVLRLRNTIAQDEIRRFVENDNVVIPRQLTPNKFVQFAADNIDILEETLDKSPTFHATQMVAFQKTKTTNINNCYDIALLPYKAKLELPENFHLLRKLYYNKNSKPVPSILNKNSILDLNTENYIRLHNISWVLCRLACKEETVVPQWSGFNKLLAEESFGTTSYGYLPLLPYVSSDYDTIFTVMKRCECISRKLNIQFTVITFDQAMYYKAKEIQWLKHEECKNYILRLGGFHIMMNFLKVIGQHMEYSGLKDIWLESGLYGESTVTGILNGKKWNKGIRAHKLTYESLLRIVISLFENWLVECKSESIHSLNFARLLAGNLCHNIKSNDTVKSFENIVQQIDGLSSILQEFIDSQSPTFKFWMSYIRLVEILLEFLYSERTAQWKFHLSSFRKMLPWFFAYDHTNYSRWGTVYLIDMVNLPHTAPEVHREFEEGNFVVKRLPGKFNTISVDQALEHVNKTSKDAGGIVGLTKKSTRLDEWYLSYNEIGLMIDAFRESFKSTSTPDPASQNIEIGAQRILIDEQSVVMLQDQFCQFKVFNHTEDNLICISTKEILSKDLETALLTAAEQGETELKKFMNIIQSDQFHKPLKKLNILKYHKTNPATSKKTNKITDSQGGQKILQQVLAAKEMGRNICHKGIFSYELTPYPMALSSNGMLASPSNKSTLGAIIESFCETSKSFPQASDDVPTCHIFDAMSVVQGLGKPANAKTFGEYADIFNTIVLKNQHKAQRIDVVFDHYIENSIKNCTRIKRKVGTTINKIIDSPNTPLPQQWHLFIHSLYNKSQLTNFLSNQLIEKSKNLSVTVVTSGGFGSITDYKSNCGVTDNLLLSTHEEADTRILLHILSAKNAGYKRCIVECKDTDVLVLLVHFKDYLTPEIWMKTGTKESRKFIAVHTISLSTCLLKNLPAFHALSGCDTTSQFSGLGKKSCWKIYLTNYNLLDNVGTAEFNDDLLKDMTKFVLRLYTPNAEISSLNDLRAAMAVTKTIDKLPPTENSVKQHCLRVHYQTKVWLRSLEPIPLLPSIFEHGWILRDNEIIPIWQTQPACPEDLNVLVTCRCKKDCTRKHCSCKKSNLTCIGSCFCMAQKSCQNRTHTKSSTTSTFSHVTDISDSDSD